MKTYQSTDLFSAVIKMPFGAMGIRSGQGKVQELVYLSSRFEEKLPTDSVSEKVAQQIGYYLSDPDFRFDLPLASVGTPFQRKVWNAIAAIPTGSVLTYGAIAKSIRSAPRAVGQACGANWFPLIIPCHRVTAAAGLGGFAHDDDETGFHVGVKRWLLVHEGVIPFLIQK